MVVVVTASRVSWSKIRNVLNISNSRRSPGGGRQVVPAVQIWAVRPPGAGHYYIIEY